MFIVPKIFCSVNGALHCCFENFCLAFWYRKRRIIGLSAGQKKFGYSLNVYPKLCLEDFNVEMINLHLRQFVTLSKGHSILYTPPPPPPC